MLSSTCQPIHAIPAASTMTAIRIDAAAATLYPWLEPDARGDKPSPRFGVGRSELMARA